MREAANVRRVSRTHAIRALVACCVASAVVTSESGCAPFGNGAAPTSAHVLRISVPSDPSTLSPLVAFSQTDIANDLLITQTLVGVDANGHVVPRLVTRVPTRANGDISPDGRRITYHLRGDARFADGVALTSKDVVFTYHAMLDPRNRAADDGPYRRIASIATPDTHTVIITLRSRWNAAVGEMFAESDFAIGILPAHPFASTHVVGVGFDDHAFGTGPFRVMSWKRGDRMVLEPNPYFVPKPKLARIEIHFIPTFESALVALRAGELDIANLGGDEAAQLRGQAGFRLERDALNGFEAVVFATHLAPANDVAVRRALAHAIDLREIATVDHDLFAPITSFFGPSVVHWRSAALQPPFVYDPARAARELDAAGWHLVGGTRTKGGTRLELLAIVSASSAAAGRRALVVQRDFAAIGVPVSIKTFPASLYNAADGPIRNGRFSLAFGGSIAGSDPEPSVTLTCALARPGGANYGRFCNRELDADLAAQAIAPTEAERNAKFARIERIVRDEVPIVPIHQYATFWGVADRVTNAYRRNPLDFPLGAEDWDVR